MIPLQLDVATRLLNPSPVLLLSSRAMQKANVMALSRYTVVSQNPPRVALALAPSRYSRRLIRSTGEFILCVPDVTSIEEVHFCGLYSGRSVDKIRVIELPTTRARMTSPLLVANCIGHLECAVVDVLRPGDLVVFVGEVVHAAVDEEYWDGRWRPNADLLFHLGADRYLVGERVLQPRHRLAPRHVIEPPAHLADPWAPLPRGAAGAAGTEEEVDW